MEKEKTQIPNAEGAQGTGAEGQLSYEELNQNFIELNIGYQKLLAQYRQLREVHEQAVEALQSKDFDYMSFFLSMLFKVMDHPEMYREDFVQWATDNIQATLVSFQEGLREGAEPNKKGAEGDEKKVTEKPKS